VSSVPSPPSVPPISPLDLPVALSLWGALAGATSATAAAKTVATWVHAHCGCDTITLWLDDGSDASYSVPEPVVPSPNLLAELRLPAGASAARWVAVPEPWVQRGAERIVPSTVASLPLGVGERRVGQVLLCWRGTPPQHLTLSYLGNLAQVAAIGLSERLARERVDDVSRALAVREDVLVAMVQPGSLEEKLRAALGSFCQELGWEIGAVYLPAGHATMLELAVSYGLPDGEPVLPEHVAYDIWPIGETLDTSGFIYAGNLSAHERGPAWARDAGLRAWLSAPLVEPSGPVGVICLASVQELQAPRLTGSILRAIGLGVGIVADNLLSRARTGRALAARNARWAALHALSTELSRGRDSGQLLEDIVRRGVDLLEAQGGLLALSEEGSGDLVIAASYRKPGFPPIPAADFRVRPDEGATGRVLSSKQPLVLDDYAAWPERIPRVAASSIGALALVPVFVADRPAGVLAVEDAPGRHFTEDDVQTLELFAQLATVLQETLLGRQRAQALALVKERSRLARDLHDGLVQDLAALLLRADACQALLGEGDEALRGPLEAISVGLQRAIRDARASIFALRSADQAGCSLQDALAAQAAQFQSQTGVPVDFSSADADCQCIDHERELALLQVTQEALTNVRKHAQAGRVRVQLTWQGAEKVELHIGDDGRGFDPSLIVRAEGGRGEHQGLILMRERVEALAGTFSVESAAGRGTIVCAVLPVRGGGGRRWAESAS